MYFLLACLDMHQAGCFHLLTVSDMIHPCLSACPNKSGEGLILVDFSHSDFWWISHTQILEDFSSSVEMPHHSVCPSGWPAASTESRHHVSLLQICYHGRISSTKIRRSNLFSKYDFNLKNRIRMSQKGSRVGVIWTYSDICGAHNRLEQQWTINNGKWAIGDGQSKSSGDSE